MMLQLEHRNKRRRDAMKFFSSASPESWRSLPKVIIIMEAAYSFSLGITILLKLLFIETQENDAGMMERILHRASWWERIRRRTSSSQHTNRMFFSHMILTRMSRDAWWNYLSFVMTHEEENVGWRGNSWMFWEEEDGWREGGGGRREDERWREERSHDAYLMVVRLSWFLPKGYKGLS